tara:strand:- start:484 stop:600 length:117 start_codon:yes stop_codon:yes gene_type:complete
VVVIIIIIIIEKKKKKKKKTHDLIRENTMDRWIENAPR